MPAFFIIIHLQAIILKYCFDCFGILCPYFSSLCTVLFYITQKNGSCVFLQAVRRQNVIQLWGACSPKVVLWPGCIARQRVMSMQRSEIRMAPLHLLALRTRSIPRSKERGQFRFCKISIHYQQYICQIISISIILYCNITMSCIDYSKNEKKEALLNERLPFSLPIMRKMELEPIVPQNKPIIERLLVHFYHNVFNLTNLN